MEKNIADGQIKYFQEVFEDFTPDQQKIFMNCLFGFVLGRGFYNDDAASLNALIEATKEAKKWK